MKPQTWHVLTPHVVACVEPRMGLHVPLVPDRGTWFQNSPERDFSLRQGFGAVGIVYLSDTLASVTTALPFGATTAELQLSCPGAGFLGVAS